MSPQLSYTIDEISEQLKDDIFVAAHWLERADAAGLLYCDGAYLRKALVRIADRMLLRLMICSVSRFGIPDASPNA